MSDSEPRLGNTTEFVSAPIEKWDLATRFYLQSLARELCPDMRVGFCMRHRQSKNGMVEIRYNEEQKRAWYHGLFRCGASWICAFCSYQISEKRREELTRGIANNLADYTPIMITYTIRHRKGQPLNMLLEKMLDAYRQMKKGRSWYLFKGETALIGSVRSLEITHTQNGWHPHIHELMLFPTSHVLDFGPDMPVSIQPGEEKKARANQWNESIKSLSDWIETQLGKFYWLPSLLKVGLSCDLEHGLKTSHSHKEIVEYISKWGKPPTNPSRLNGKWSVETELTKAALKHGRMSGSRTPFEILADYGNGDRESGLLFIEYAGATFGRSQLQWTPGLKSLLKIEEITDENAAQLEPEVFEILAELDVEVWRVILRSNSRAKLLEIASTGDVEKVYAYLEEIMINDVAD